MSEKTIKLNILKKGGVFSSITGGLIPLTSKNCVFKEEIAKELIKAGLAEIDDGSSSDEAVDTKAQKVLQEENENLKKEGNSLKKDNETLKTENSSKEEKIKALEEKELQYIEEIKKLEEKEKELLSQIEELKKEKENTETSENTEIKKTTKKNKE